MEKSSKIRVERHYVFLSDIPPVFTTKFKKEHSGYLKDISSKLYKNFSTKLKDLNIDKSHTYLLTACPPTVHIPKLVVNSPKKGSFQENRNNDLQRSKVLPGKDFMRPKLLYRFMWWRTSF